MPHEPEQEGFVVWIDREGASPGSLSGRVECVRSAERARFEGCEQLLALIERWAAPAPVEAEASGDPPSE